MWGEERQKRCFNSLKDPRRPFGLEIKYLVWGFFPIEAEKNAGLELGTEGSTRSMANTHIRDTDGNDARAGDGPLTPPASTPPILDPACLVLGVDTEAVVFHRNLIIFDTSLLL